jgi:glutathione S-transferase
MLTLYYSPGACSIAPHVVLEEIGIDYDVRRVSIADGEHKSAAYRDINPQARVPSLMIDGQVVTEVPALLAYIASLRPERGLIPVGGSLDQARCFELLAFLSSSLHIAYAQLWRPERFLSDDFERQDLFSALGREAIQRFNAEIEERLVGPWAMGETYTVADAYLLPFYRWGVRIGLDMVATCPRWSRWATRMTARAAVRSVIEREGIGLDWVPDFAGDRLSAGA